MRKCFCLLAVFIGLLLQVAIAQRMLTLDRPELFALLDTTVMTPDAMAFDASGNIYLSVTNATTFERFGAMIMKLSASGKVLKTWKTIPAHPGSGKVHPMGMAIGTDSCLYIVDNQSFAGQKHASRILRARINNGDLHEIKTVVTGLNVANGLRFFEGSIFVTDAWTDNARKSGLYKFNISDLRKTAVVIDQKNREQYLVHEWELDKDRQDGVGVDGLDFDGQGNLYVGNFSDGTITRFAYKSGKLKADRIIKDNSLIGCDGIFFDKRSNSLLIANFLRNSILQYRLSTESLHTLWKNDDAQCTAALDCPCDLAVVGNKLIVVNFDTYTTPANKTIDNCNTISVFTITR